MTKKCVYFLIMLNVFSAMGCQYTLEELANPPYWAEHRAQTMQDILGEDDPARLKDWTKFCERRLDWLRKNTLTPEEYAQETQRRAEKQLNIYKESHDGTSPFFFQSVEEFMKKVDGIFRYIEDIERARLHINLCSAVSDHLAYAAKGRPLQYSYLLGEEEFFEHIGESVDSFVNVVSPCLRYRPDTAWRTHLFFSDRTWSSRYLETEDGLYQPIDWLIMFAYDGVLLQSYSADVEKGAFATAHSGLYWGNASIEFHDFGHNVAVTENNERFQSMTGVRRQDFVRSLLHCCGKYSASLPLLALSVVSAFYVLHETTISYQGWLGVHADLFLPLPKRLEDKGYRGLLVPWTQERNDAVLSEQFNGFIDATVRKPFLDSILCDMGLVVQENVKRSRHYHHWQELRQLSEGICLPLCSMPDIHYFVKNIYKILCQKDVGNGEEIESMLSSYRCALAFALSRQGVAATHCSYKQERGVAFFEKAVGLLQPNEIKALSTVLTTCAQSLVPERYGKIEPMLEVLANYDAAEEGADEEVLWLKEWLSDEASVRECYTRCMGKNSEVPGAQVQEFLKEINQKMLDRPYIAHHVTRELINGDEDQWLGYLVCTPTAQLHGFNASTAELQHQFLRDLGEEAHEVRRRCIAPAQSGVMTEDEQIMFEFYTARLFKKLGYVPAQHQWDAFLQTLNRRWGKKGTNVFAGISYPGK